MKLLLRLLAGVGIGAVCVAALLALDFAAPAVFAPVVVAPAWHLLPLLTEILPDSLLDWVVGPPPESGADAAVALIGFFTIAFWWIVFSTAAWFYLRRTARKRALAKR